MVMDALYSVLTEHGRIDGPEAYCALMALPPCARRLALDTVDLITIARCDVARREFMLLDRGKRSRTRTHMRR
jgi:hypothetical protein